MVLENERISVGHVSKVLTDLFAGLAPIGAEVFDEVRGLCWFARGVFQTFQREHTNIEQCPLLGARIRLDPSRNACVEDQNNQHESRP